MTNFFKAYSNPDRYAINVPIANIVADKKVDMKSIQRIISMINSGKATKAIVVVKHPEKEYYAVLDGHHRFWAQKKVGKSTIRCAVIEDAVGLGFYLTKEGVFQPSPKITRYIRMPLKRFYQYMSDFIRAPEVLLQKQRDK